jgi:hypothetical protein
VLEIPRFGTDSQKGLKIFDVNQLLDSHMADLRHLLAVKAVYFKIFAQQRLPSPQTRP